MEPSENKQQIQQKENTKLKVCVLQPDYDTSNESYSYDGLLDDPPRDLQHLIPEMEVDHVLLNKLSTYKQLKMLSKKKYDIFVNLCESFVEWSVAGLDVIHALDLLNLPYTGTTTNLYDPTKEQMKFIAYSQGVHTAKYAFVESLDQLEEAIKHLQYPLFVKPNKWGCSHGIDDNQRSNDYVHLRQKVSQLVDEFGPLLIEEYVEGTEYTVLVAGNTQGQPCLTFTPIELTFPDGLQFRSWTTWSNFAPCRDPDLDRRLREESVKIFQGFNAVGYGRVDYRVNLKGEIFFLEINFACSVFYTPDKCHIAEADHILNNDPMGQSDFLRHIIKEGMERHSLKQKGYILRQNSKMGDQYRFGVIATRDFFPNQIIINGNDIHHKVVLKRYAKSHYNEIQKKNLSKYGMPISEEIFVMWDQNPGGEWVPINHGCQANAMQDGLIIKAIGHIKKGDEITIDFGNAINDLQEQHKCNCGSQTCKGLINGKQENHITNKEIQHNCNQKDTSFH